jgi:peptidoglycan/xylan/chitin deacetylase (PgdA/CDA1 family)
MIRSRRLAHVTTILAATAVLTGALVSAPAAGPDQSDYLVTASAATKCPTPKSSPLRAVPATQSKNVALTFDDGPGPQTAKFLDVLKAKRVRATFFVTGPKVRANPALARRIVREGHVIANHTWSHPQNIAGSSPRGSFDKLSKQIQADQMDRTSAEIRRVTGVTPCFFRAPGGHHFGSTTVSLARARGMNIVHWSRDTGDWASPKTLNRSFQNSIVAKGTTTARHPIVLMHDGKASPEPESKVSSFRGNTAAALPRVIDYYDARGYTFTDPAGKKVPVK